jgi:hypothetical protein
MHLSRRRHLILLVCVCVPCATTRTASSGSLECLTSCHMQTAFFLRRQDHRESVSRFERGRAARSRSFDRRALPSTLRPRRRRSTRGEVPGDRTNSAASVPDGLLLRMRVATRLARLIARLRDCAPLCEFAHHPLELKFCCGMHQRQRRKPAKRSGTAGRQRAKKKVRIIK